MSPLTVGSIPLVYLFIALSLLLPRIPVVGKFFSVINTINHEFGHALMALLLEGKVHKIEIFRDSSGATTTQSKSRLANFLIAFIGYPFSACIAYMIFKLYAVGYCYGIIWGLSIAFVFILILWVRNFYGFLWIALFTALNAGLIYLDNPLYLQIAALLYATSMAVDSLISTFVLFYLAVTAPEKAGDATLLRKITGIPAFFWALLFVAFSVWISYLIWVDNPSLFNF